MRARKLGIGILILIVAAIPVILFLRHRRHRAPLTLKGAVVIRDSDPNKEQPIAGVEVSEANGYAMENSRSDSSGFFTLQLLPEIRRGHPITLRFRHPNYKPLDVQDYVGDQLYVAKMVPRSQATPAANGPRTKIGNVRVRYLMKAMTNINIGSAVKTFQVENRGNVPCMGHNPCSPDGKWRAAISSGSLDAGAGNEFHNARVSCIAGPCPFTRIETDHFSQGGQNIAVTVRNWSDTTTFLMEAEVFHPMVSQVVHESYPVVFGRTLSFTLPSSAEGVSIQADVDSKAIIFPLGPALRLSWADCNARVNPDDSKVYRCELKPDFQFQ